MQTKHGTAALSNRLSDLSRRISRLRLPQKAIAEQSGLNEDTISRTLTGKTDPLNSTLDKIETVVAAEEENLRGALKQGAA
jgi:predicted transcriptional regulator